jgi:hypothetical protein
VGIDFVQQDLTAGRSGQRQSPVEQLGRAGMASNDEDSRLRQCLYDHSQKRICGSGIECVGGVTQHDPLRANDAEPNTPRDFTLEGAEGSPR